MSLSHVLKSVNRRLGLSNSILQNQQGRLSSSASNGASQAMYHPNRKIETIENKGSSSWLPNLLRGRLYSQPQSCSDDALYESVLLIGLPLLASSVMLLHLSISADDHEQHLRRLELFEIIVLIDKMSSTRPCRRFVRGNSDQA